MRTVIFDLDGTLVDSAPDIHAAVAAMLADLGRAPLDLATVVGFVGHGAARLVERCLAATGGADARGLGLFHAHYAAAPCALTRAYPGVAEALARLAGAGVILGVCTNKPEAPARRVLAGTGLADRFGVVVGGDTVGALKPDPAPLRHALALLGGGPALFVGDSEIDAAAAQAAGLPFALYTLGYAHVPPEAMVAAHRFDDWTTLPRLVL